MTLEDLIVDEEFKAIFDADGHSADQLQGMEESLEEFGYGGDRIEHWHGLIVDGYTRYSIWLRKHKDDPDAPRPEIFEISAPDRKAVVRYMLSKQINRRNIEKKRLAYYRGKLAKESVPMSGGGQPEGHVPSTRRKTPARRRNGHADAAKKMSVDRSTLHRAEKFAEAVDSLESRGVATKKELLNGDVTASDVVKAAKCSTKSEAKQVLHGNKTTPSEKMELGKRFGSPLKVLQKLNDDYPFDKFHYVEALIREWYESTAKAI